MAAAEAANRAAARAATDADEPPILTPLRDICVLLCCWKNANFAFTNAGPAPLPVLVPALKLTTAPVPPIRVAVPVVLGTFEIAARGFDSGLYADVGDGGIEPAPAAMYSDSDLRGCDNREAAPAGIDTLPLPIVVVPPLPPPPPAAPPATPFAAEPPTTIEAVLVPPGVLGDVPPPVVTDSLIRSIRAERVSILRLLLRSSEQRVNSEYRQTTVTSVSAGTETETETERTSVEGGQTKFRRFGWNMNTVHVHITCSGFTQFRMEKRRRNDRHTRTI